jgi:hypothetical protein
MPEEDNIEAEQAEQQQIQERQAELSAKRAQAALAAKKKDNPASNLVNKAADTMLQKGLDSFKLAILPFSWLVLPLIIIFLTIIAELFLPLFRPSWKLPLWRTFLYLIIDFIILFILFMIVGIFVTIKEHPDVICKALGGDWLGWATGPICTVAGDIFSPFK